MSTLTTILVIILIVVIAFVIGITIYDKMKSNKLNH